MARHPRLRKAAQRLAGLDLDPAIGHVSQATGCFSAARPACHGAISRRFRRVRPTGYSDRRSFACEIVAVFIRTMLARRALRVNETLGYVFWITMLGNFAEKSAAFCATDTATLRAMAL